MVAPGLKTSGRLSDTCIADEESKSRFTAMTVTIYTLEYLTHVPVVNTVTTIVKCNHHIIKQSELCNLGLQQSRAP